SAFSSPHCGEEKIDLPARLWRLPSMHDIAASLPVVIVGGGFSGAMLAARLAEQGQASVLIERGEQIGLGVAYAADLDEHRLNVRSERMSARPDRPADFVDWLTACAPAFADPNGF